MSESPAITAYCRRIGFDGSREPDLDTLAELHRLHPAAIPFENLHTLTGRPVSLDLGDIEAKLVHRRRGGYCFEHNRLFAAVLDACGFRVRSLAARVIFNREGDSPIPRTHMLLLAWTGRRPWLCDVGFGGLSLTAPLMFEPGSEQRAGDTVYRIMHANGIYELQASIEGRWKGLYRFDLQPQLTVDFEMMNHYVATHPQSHFRTTLLAARAVGEGRYALTNNRFTVYWPDGTHDVRVAATVGELHALLAERFGIEIELDSDLEGALARCIAAQAA